MLAEDFFVVIIVLVFPVGIVGVFIVREEMFVTNRAGLISAVIDDDGDASRLVFVEPVGEFDRNTNAAVALVGAKTLGVSRAVVIN